jgi:CheY-like chemotaxis protein
VQQSIQTLDLDDEAAVPRGVKLLLEHDEHEVWVVDSGEAALEHLAERKFDLVIKDFCDARNALGINSLSASVN